MNGSTLGSFFALPMLFASLATYTVCCAKGGDGEDETPYWASGGESGDAGGSGCETPEDCPGSDTTCRYRTCEKGVCDVENAPRLTACTEDDGAFCDGRGRCVECESAADCPPDNSCERNRCVVPQCTNGTVDGTESDIDCGGDECPACENGKACNDADDCESRFCDDSPEKGTCAACKKDEDCGNGGYCDTDGGNVCADLKSNGDKCARADECSSGHCADTHCCNTACDGVCESCAVGSKEGACTSQIEGTDPDNDCAGDVCGAGRKCRCADNIKNGEETDRDCGGPDCAPCEPYETCALPRDCVSGVCRGAPWGRCQRERCGDGVVNQDTEVCDGDGMGTEGETATCDLDCTPAECGDGTTNATAGETCDDGDRDNSDDCPDGAGGTCRNAVCGDGHIFNNGGLETCDDGDGDNFDECPDGVGGTCKDAVCGDGFVRSAGDDPEDCEGNDVGDENCASQGAGVGPLKCVGCAFDTSLCVIPDGGVDDAGADDAGS
jgi:hypothetical protein